MTTPAINARVASFVSDLEGLVRKAALESLQAALGGGAPARSASSSTPSKRPAAKAPAAKPAPASKPSGVVAKRKGARRSAEDVAASARAIKAHLLEHPGEGVETIAKHLGVPTKDLALPIINLLAAKSIRKEGQRRGTRYFVAGSSEGKAAIAPAAAPAPKAAEKPAKGKKAKKK